jgi:hypothetical protein
MATTTPNYGWSVPTSTDLVKDGATAIETLGDSVDATVKALNPETTLGDIAYRSSTANTNTRLGIGTSGQVLAVSGGVPAWTSPAASGMTLISRTTASNVASLTMDSVFTSTYKSYVIVMEKFWAATAADNIGFNLRFGTTDKTDAYYGSSGALRSDSDTLGRTGTSNGAFFSLTSDSASSASNFTMYINQVGQGSGPYPAFHGTGFRQEQGNAAVFFGGLCYASEAYSGIKFKSASSNITIDVAIYGLAAS